MDTNRMDILKLVVRSRMQSERGLMRKEVGGGSRVDVVGNADGDGL